MLCSPVAGFAIGLGEAEMQSKLGEPLLMRAALTLNAGENVDKSCLRLSVSEPLTGDSRQYFSQAKMAINKEGGRQYVSISSPLPFDDLFAKVQLQIKCPGIGNFSKILTVLPDPDFSSAKVAVNPPSIPPSPAQIPASVSVAPAPASLAPKGMHSATETPVAMPNINILTKATVKSRSSGERAMARHPHNAQADHGRQTAFRLKLSGEPIDESRIGKISPEQRELLLAQQKLLDSDDETARVLDLQHQVKQLQDELGLIRLKLDKMELGSSASAASSGLARSDSQTIAGQKPGTPLKLPAIQQENQGMQFGWMAAASFLLAVLALWLGLKYYNRLKSGHSGLPDAEKFSGQYAARGINLPRPPVLPEGSPVKHDELSPAAPVPVKEVAQPSRLIKSKEELAEHDSMLEEAELYATHGHAEKAVEILREIIAQNRTYTEAWVLLMSILSSLGKTADFERQAREFYRYNPQSESWKMIQALGRTLDQDNPLYAGDRHLDVAAKFLRQLALQKKRLIGDILVEMGAMSEQDLLNCMADFDPKKHGRFGGYLVSHKMITHAQLNQALLDQQGVGGESASNARLTLKDMESFLSNFNAEHDESIGAYLVSHGMITAEQLKKALQQDSEAEPGSPGSEADRNAAESAADAGGDIWDAYPDSDKLGRTRIIDPGSETWSIEKQDNPLISDIPAPGIDFDIGSVIPKKSGS